ncbi:MAG: hypothetical protein FWE85_02135 [Clostridiales bacterium]|nr:hypothetical protein [Clostridiales bacterium]
MDKNKLKEYRNILAELAELQEELASLRGGALECLRLDGMPRSSHKGDRTASAVTKIFFLEEMLMEKIGTLTALRLEIERAIEELPSLERRILRLRYVEGNSWEDISVTISYSMPHIWRLHDRILKKIC